VYFTQAGQKLTLPFTTSPRTTITRLYALLEQGESAGLEYSVKKINREGDSLLLGPYFTVDADGWLRLNQELTKELGTYYPKNTLSGEKSN
jgi:hypothetical protein